MRGTRLSTPTTKIKNVLKTVKRLAMSKKVSTFALSNKKRNNYD